MIQLLTYFLRVQSERILEDNNLEVIDFFVVKYEERFESKSDCDVKLDAILDLYKQKQEVMTSPQKEDDGQVLDVLSQLQYPQPHEFEAFILLVKKIKDRYRFFSFSDKKEFELDRSVALETVRSQQFYFFQRDSEVKEQIY